VVTHLLPHLNRPIQNKLSNGVAIGWIKIHLPPDG